MSALATTQTCSPWWGTESGFFCPFVLDAAALSDEARGVAGRLRALDLPGSVLLRGSVVESHAPFSGSDLDVLVVTDAALPPATLSAIREVSQRHVDLKILRTTYLEQNLVQRALLAHRSWLVSGPPPPLALVAADAEFAWQQWLACLPVGLPPDITSTDPLAVYTLKSAARAFGVLSLLRDGRYTRDVDACLEVAFELAPAAADGLRGLRASLEAAEDAHYDLSRVRAALLRLHSQFA